MIVFLVLQLAGAAFIAAGFWAWSEKVSELSSEEGTMAVGSITTCLLALSLVSVGGLVGLDPGDPAAWLRPSLAGPGGRRDHIYPRLCWLRGSPEREHLSAEVCMFKALMYYMHKKMDLLNEKDVSHQVLAKLQFFTCSSWV